MAGLILTVFLIARASFAGEAVSGYDVRSQNFADQKQACSELAVGSSRIVNAPSPGNTLSADGKVTSFEMKYTVTRTGAKTYKVHIPVVFIPDGDFSRDFPEMEKLGNDAERDAHVDRVYRQRVRNCLKKENPKLKDKNGIHLELSIDATAGDAYKQPSGFTHVDIKKNGIRSHSTSYVDSIDCPTIVHELLHLTGLCDEYREFVGAKGKTKDSKGKVIDPKKLGFENVPDVATQKFDCRAVPKDHSIMGNHYISMTDSPLIAAHNCICQKPPCHVPPNIAKLATDGNVVVDDISKLPDCPPGYEKKSYHQYADTLVLHISRSTNFGEFFSTFYRMPTNTSPLRTSHTRHILFPGCHEKNKKYYRCSRLAYETSTVEGCNDFKDECRKDDSWLD